MSRCLRCERCGTDFSCGCDDGICWCIREEFRLPLPGTVEGGPRDCLCPACLRAYASEVLGEQAGVDVVDESPDLAAPGEELVGAQKLDISSEPT